MSESLCAVRPIAYHYFSATLTGFNGSRGREIVKVCGCWNTEAEAQDALDEACIKKREAWCDSRGVSYDDEIADDRFRGWLGDYQRTAVTFSVTYEIDNKLVHSLSRTLSPNELPDCSNSEVTEAIGV